MRLTFLEFRRHGGVVGFRSVKTFAVRQPRVNKAACASKELETSHNFRTLSQLSAENARSTFAHTFASLARAN